MPEVCLIDWNVLEQNWTLLQYGKPTKYYYDVADVLLEAQRAGCLVVANEGMTENALPILIGAAAQMKIELHNRYGAVLASTPVPEATVRYITRAELGKVLPDGWFIEQQLGRYAACHGEDMTLPYRTSIQRAIMDIHAFLGATIAQAAGELVHSLAASLEQQSFDI